MGELLVNATIESTSLGFLDHGVMSFWLHLSYGGSSQGFGGVRLDGAPAIACEGMRLITGILQTLEVDTWEHLPGVPLRVRQNEGGLITGIGHYLKDEWLMLSGEEAPE